MSFTLFAWKKRKIALELLLDCLGPSILHRAVFFWILRVNLDDIMALAFLFFLVGLD
jgi:hypothetical protein